MSKRSDEFENKIVEFVKQNINQPLPTQLPKWMIDEGIVPEAIIQDVKGIGSKDSKNKTDVIIHLSEGAPIKISAKLLNADYFGNWYGHKRFIDEFGCKAFQRMTTAATCWANKWSKSAKAPFVGVSICFGKRAGQTFDKFTDIFNIEDILTVTKGYGECDSVANCMYIADTPANTLSELIQSLDEISIENINKVTEEFKVAYRPINPLTEKSNRGKNVYTKFKPFKRLEELTTISNAQQLFKLGEFVTVEPTKINHNHILDELERDYNIKIPRKES
ncbi:TPA: hypothetical protein U3P08_001496 [Streptococcus agalactiae]|nr:hypothetical protein [Streptococcus agalactiae]